MTQCKVGVCGWCRASGQVAGGWAEGTEAGARAEVGEGGPPEQARLVAARGPWPILPHASRLSASSPQEGKAPRAPRMPRSPAQERWEARREGRAHLADKGAAKGVLHGRGELGVEPHQLQRRLRLIPRRLARRRQRGGRHVARGDLRMAATAAGQFGGGAGSTELSQPSMLRPVQHKHGKWRACRMLPHTLPPPARPAAPTLFSGMMVTRLRSCPLASSALAVCSVSTTTCARGGGMGRGSRQPGTRQALLFSRPGTRGPPRHALGQRCQQEQAGKLCSV